MRNISNPGRVEFILLVAFTLMSVAFAIDSMLPALPHIGASFSLTDNKQLVEVISVFFVGFGAGQLFVGTFADRFGRRNVLLIGLAGYAVLGLAAGLATSFTLLLVLRVFEGATAAVGRVVITSVVRDRFVGREMAQFMSLASMIFMAAPILAPSLGALIMLVASWRMIFVVLAAIGAFIFIWVYLRLPETLAPENRRPVNPAQIAESMLLVIRDRASVGYTFGIMCMQVFIVSYLTSVQSFYSVIFHRPALLSLGFAISAATMAVVSLINSQMVMRYGMRKIGHSGLIGFIVMAVVGVFVCGSPHITIPVFLIVQSMLMMCFAFASANFGAMAMEHVGEVAGTAASLQGFASTVFGALIGAWIGQQFDGTMRPFYLGCVGAGVCALAAVFWTERGSLFVPRSKSLAVVRQQ